MTSTDGNDRSHIFVVCIDRHLKVRPISSKQCNGSISRSSEIAVESISRDFIAEILDKLGGESANAQKLRVPITTSLKFTANTCEDIIFIPFQTGIDDSSNESYLCELGFIRFGRRDLYVAHENCLKHLPNCPAILDFYIRPKRCGYGKILFDTLLDQLSMKAQAIAYDRPSDSMIAFLRKHYDLHRPQWQHNHFVIFDGIFAFS